MSKSEKEHVTTFFINILKDLGLSILKIFLNLKKDKMSLDFRSDLPRIKKSIFNMIKAGIIGAGIGLRHFDAINNYRNSKVVCILERDKKGSKIKKKI